MNEHNNMDFQEIRIGLNHTITRTKLNNKNNHLNNIFQEKGRYRKQLKINPNW